MTTEIHLTRQLQFELDKIGSGIRLQTNQDFGNKLNYKDWAWASLNDRQIQASILPGKSGKHMQFEERGSIVCISTTTDIAEMAILVDKWLSKKMALWQLVKDHKSISISE